MAPLWTPSPSGGRARGSEALVSDSGNHRIRAVGGATGETRTIAGTGVRGHLDGAVTTATFDDPAGIAGDQAGTIFVADRGNQVIRRIQGGMVSTLAGSPGIAAFQDGAGAEG